MKKTNEIGIIAYGSYIPKYFIKGNTIEAAHNKIGANIYKSLGVFQKSVPAIDEDTVTISVESANQSLERYFTDSKNNLEIKNEIGCLFIGSESHPYAVKPTGTIVKQALGISDNISLADLQFACKAGTQSLQICLSFVASGFAKYGLAIGSDTAQSKQGDVLEYTAGSGSASFIVGSENLLAKLLGTVSIATDTPDFWRRPGMSYPEHAGRFSGEPAYFSHIFNAAAKLMNKLNLEAKDFDFCIFHTPNAKFPSLIAKKLGFSEDQLAPSLVVKKIGNTYAAASMLAFSAVLDVAKKSQKILLVSYGSGSGSDAFVFETTKNLETSRNKWNNFVSSQINSMKEIDYQTYIQNVAEK